MNSTTIPTKTPRGEDFCHYCRWFLRDETMDLMEKYLSRIKAVRKTYKIYSKTLDDFLWITATNTEMQKMLAEGVEEPIYTYDDVVKLDGISKEELKAIHKIKRVFPGSTVEDIKHENRIGK